MFELKSDHFDRARKVFAPLSSCTPLQAVLDGNSPGRVFVDDAANPAVGLIWTPWGYYYLAGEVDNDAFNHALWARLSEELIPASVAMGECCPLLYPYPASWEGKLDVILQGRTPDKVYRRTFTFDPSAFARHRGWRDRVPPDDRVIPVSEVLAMPGGDEIAEGIAVTWKSLEAFLEKGFGFCLLHAEEAASFCYACFVGNGEAEINIRTQEQFRGRGFASLVASAMIEHSLSTGLTPSWECWWDNESSDALARKLGFVPRCDFPVYAWEESE